MQWPPDFSKEIARREKVSLIINSSPDPHSTAKAFYKDDCVLFIRDCCITIDPRNPARDLPAKMPFIPFPRQVELIEFIIQLTRDEENGLVEKSRDMGATWICCAVSVWMWLYKAGSAVGWGSRKEALVDKIGDPDSIFEKIRVLIRELPSYCLPPDYNEKKSLSYMKVINTDNGATITGESGDNIGRGGRSSLFVKDESAHYERPELIEAALGDNTNVQLDVSSVCGEGTVFHRKRMSGTVRVFVMDWRDHPAKTQEWYDKRKELAESQGLNHIFAQEVDRDYAAAVEGIFIPAEYVRACIDAHIKLGIEPTGERRAGLDVADAEFGGDTNALIDVHGPVLQEIEQWRERDTGITAIRAWNYCLNNGVTRLTYDSIGVGAGVKAKTNELAGMPENEKVDLIINGFAASGIGGIVDPDEEFAPGRTNADMFSGSKAQVWWMVRSRCHDTYKAVVEGKEISPDRIISIPSKLRLCQALVSELSRPKLEFNEAGKICVESKKKMKKRSVPSPNLADALIMCYVPAEVDNMALLLQMAMGKN